MRNFQEARYRSYRTLISYSDENTAITGNLPEYNANLAKLKITVNAIDVAAIEQKTDTTGITSYKLQLKHQLTTLGADNARKLTSFAKLTHDPILLSKVNLTESDFKRFSDEALKDYSQVIYDCAIPLISQLENYDITADSLDVFEGAINDYNEVLVSPDIAETIKKQATIKLVRLFIEADGYVANMAAAVEIVRIKESIFYLGFKTAQKITIRGRVKLLVKGQTVDNNGEPLPGVTITATLNGEVVLVKKSSKKGGFYLKSMAEGIYQFTFKKGGFADQMINVVVNHGETTKLKVAMANA